MIDQIRFFAGAARVLEGRSAGEYMRGHTSWIRREPIGVIGQVTPWNYPMMMAIWKIAPALAAGNTVVLKPSDTTPETTLLLAEIRRGPLPAARHVQRRHRRPGHRAAGRRAPDPDMVAITGSVRAGAGCRAAADGLKRVHLELGRQGTGRRLRRRRPRGGGRGHRDRRVLQRRPGLHGRDASARRAGVYDDFVAALGNMQRRARAKVEASRRRRGAPGAGEQPEPSSRGSPASSSECPSHARVVAGGVSDEGSATAYFIEPTVLAGLRQDDEHDPERDLRAGHHGAALHRRGRSGPSWANGVDYGLASSVWTKDFGGRCGWPRALDFGCVWINTHIPLVAEMPHGGFKHSGYGKDLSMYGLEDYTRIKHVMANIES
jgi:betaine-aldehyde dehydrogenase